MNKLSRISLAAMSCAALYLASANVHAQSSGVGGTQNPTDPAYGVSGNPSSSTSGSSTSGGMSNTIGSQGGQQTYDPTLSGIGSAPSATNTSASGAQYEPLPTEPTAAGYGTGSTRYSWIPYTTSGFIGLSVGNGSLNMDCVAGQECDDPKGSINFYTGGMFTPYIGMQLGYFRLGDTDRNGGKTKVSGANIALIGVAPLGTNFSLVGRAGGTYAWTDVTAGALVPAPTGEEEGFGAAYGVGVSWDFHPNWSATVDWDRHHVKYAGVDGKKKVEIATIGLKYRF